jgi:hypothetical protein
VPLRLVGSEMCIRDRAEERRDQSERETFMHESLLG